MLVNYYNEINSFNAGWLRELIRANIIAPGEVDERSIVEVQPGDLRGFTQCHFFAGVGVWSYAIRRAGWPDDVAVWTGSCPCQSFSASGKRRGFSDPRHLWPAWFRLIRECRPDVCFGEQVASNDGLAWLDVVSADLEGEGYAVGPCDTCAAGYGAPHIRQRLYFVARAEDSQRWPGECGAEEGTGPNGERWRGSVGQLGDTPEHGREVRQHQDGSLRGQGPEQGSAASSLANAEHGIASEQGTERRRSTEPSLRGPTNGFWADAEWIPCRGKIPGTVDWRPIKPGTFPLAHGAAKRVGRLRGYGNCLVAAQAEAFIKTYLSIQAILTIENQTHNPA